jgi:Xaa-Pro aminopeptidase
MDANFFKKNRLNLIQSVAGAVFILRAHSMQQRRSDMAYKFEQEANFWYLCGIEEPDWTLVIDNTQHRSWLVMPNVTDVHKIFDGSLSAEDAKRISGVDAVITEDESLPLLRTLAKRHSIVYTIGQPPHAEYFNFTLNPAIDKNKQMLARVFSKVEDCRKELAALRAIKHPEELVMMQKAIDITIDAFESVRASMDLYKYEYEIEADFNLLIRKRGATGHAYEPIVAGAKNACTLHYVKNAAKLPAKSMVLIDVGASYGGYAADISRTYAYKSQKKRYIDIHAAVEKAHKQIIMLISPLQSVEEYQKSVDEIMIDSLKKLGLYKDETSLRRYFPHAVSHGLGIDVHDSLGAPKHFQEGMVLTVEPGIYIPEENIGVRIEDDIMVTASGRKNLSARLSTGL